MYSQLAHDTHLQLSLLDQAQKHRLIELDEVIEDTVDRVIQAYHARSQPASILFTAHPVTSFNPGRISAVSTMDYADIDIRLPPGLDERELKWLVKQIVREVYEALWDENE